MMFGKALIGIGQVLCTLQVNIVAFIMAFYMDDKSTKDLLSHNFIKKRTSRCCLPRVLPGEGGTSPRF
jgi:hypothetical protein